ncbi:LysR family transcriptional regulator, partial [Rhizobium ruizarguesonis]
RDDAVCWFASPGLVRPQDGAVPLVSMVAECRLRRHSMDTLDRAGIAWREAFIGGGMAVVAAAVQVGLGVAALATRIAPAGTVDIGADWG